MIPIVSDSYYSIMNRPIVTVKQGKLQGILQENVLGSHYVAFKGIPFAAPPVGELRFKDPEPPASWDGIRDASENGGDVCSQLDPFTKTVIGGEDCLYLNVYVSRELYGTTRNPVMVWIHGGAYLVGSGNDILYRPDYLLAKGVILVCVNYRLGAFDLFHKAIFQSGISTCTWAIEENQPEANSFKLASILGNDSKDPETVVEFLRTVPAEKIAEAQYQVLTAEEARVSNVPFTPTIDKKAKRPVLPRPLHQLLDEDNDIPIILGHTSHEYLMFLKDTEEITVKTIYGNIPRYVEKFINSSDPKKVMQLTEHVKQWYFNDKPCTENSFPFIIQFLGDIFFGLPTKELVNRRRKRKQAPTYLYTFSYIGSQITSTKLMGHVLPIIGASHADDTSYLFYKTKCKINDSKPPAVGTKDRKVMEALTSMWANFAKTGNPTPVVDQNDPKPPASWDGIRNASENGNVSLQLDLLTETVIGDEDCLYLNVYVPCSIHGTMRNPVMIWIHGGAYLIGTGSDVNQRPDYLLTKEVIVVSINYRLGALGFLKLGHETTSGNQGLKDQIAALKWVRENIQVFGGDPANITVFANSAGAASTHLLMLSPLSKETQQEMISFKLASLLGNDSKNPEEIIEFLRTIPADEIVKAQGQCQFLTPKDKYGFNLQFSPVIDNDVKKPLFPCPLHQLLNDDNDIPIIVGYTTHEYILFLDDPSEKTLKIIYEDLPHHVRKVRNLQDPVKILQLTERAKQCRRKRKEAVTYFYKFSYIGGQTTTKHMLLGDKVAMTGAAHDDELSYLFYMPKYKVNDPKPPAIGTKDRKVLEALTSMWTNFAKTGNPTPVLDQNVPTTWLPATADALNYLEINDALQCATITDYTNIFQESD
ncbi:hypothetical protein DMN91_006450 [Ooceraea biroi]|uniref:Carboxylesterase type B domain-containing protein n=1 Tax=Ooceraea biroi TaxID=2015173 RepID=A0A3L8DNP7_OOCBI|nr:hypothetical protein DMN91_006450 [Ooceraea biroi]